MTTESTAAQLHKSSLVIDSHNDAIVAYIRRNGESIAGPEAPARSEPESVVAFSAGYGGTGRARDAGQPA